MIRCNYNLLSLVCQPILPPSIRSATTLPVRNHHSIYTHSLSYIVRPTALLSEYDDLRHELELVIPNDCLTASSKHDSNLVYSIIFSSISDDTAKTYVRQNNKLKNGCIGWTNIKDLYMGKNNLETKIREFLALINKQNYTGNGMGDATHVTTRLFKCYSALDDLKTYKSEADKLRHLRGIINMGGGLKVPYHISV